MVGPADQPFPRPKILDDRPTTAMTRTSRSEIAFLLAVVASVCLVQWVVIERATVPALDAVRFVRSARLLSAGDPLELIRSAPDAPLFALWVAAVHAALAGSIGGFREAWALSPQIAAALPLVLLPIPVYGLSRRLVGPRSASYGVILLVFLPELVRLGGDGISDTTHLFLLSLAMWMLAVVFTAQGMGARAGLALAAAAGVATGLAALVRAEALVLALAGAIVLLAGRFHPTSVCHRHRFSSAIAYGIGLAAITGFYALLVRIPAVDGLPACSSNAATTSALAGSPLDSAPLEINLPGEEKLCFAPKDPTISIRRRGWAAASVQVLEKLAKAFAYLPGILAIVGFWSLRRRPASSADRLLQLFTWLLLGGIVVHTAREGYLSARHLLPLCVVATACMGQGIEAAAGALYRVLPWFPSSCLGTIQCRRPFLSVAITACLAATCLVEGARPIHRTRLGHRLAAEWLAGHASLGQTVVDTQGLTGLYSGLPTISYEASRAELGRDELCYFVVEDQELRRASDRSRTLNLLLATAGRRAAAFPDARKPDAEAAGVSIYRWDARRFRAAAVAGPIGSPTENGSAGSAIGGPGKTGPASREFVVCLGDGGSPARE